MNTFAQQKTKNGSLEREIPVLPAVYGLYMLRFLRTRGIREEAILDGFNLDCNLFEKPDGFLSLKQMERLLERVSELAPSPATGFEFGRELGPVRHGLLGFTLLRQMNFREVVHRGVEYLRVRLPLMELHIDDAGEGLTLTVEDLWHLGSIRDFVAQIYMGSICTLTNLITRNTRLQFDFPAPMHPAAFERIAGCEVQFGGEANQAFLSFSSGATDTRSLNPELVTTQNTRTELDLDDDREVVMQVRHLLLKHPGRNGTLERVSEQLGLSPRSLRRRLHNAGFSFTRLRNEVREEFATRYLRGTGMPMEKIATRLGYSDQASFTKAFRSWTGRSPGTVRREARDR
jgi:AraC-like DNA-binding protein